MGLKSTSNHKIWQLAWPMIIANLSVPMLGIVDTAILGHLDDVRYIAAVAIGSSILSFLYWGFGFLRMGTTGLAAQAFGRQQHEQSRLIIGQSILLGAGLGLALLVLSPLLLPLGLALIAPAESYKLAAGYSQIRLFSAPAVLINYAIIGWLIGRQNTRWPLIISFTTNGINVVLDFALIIGLEMNAEGAAWATLIAEYAGCTLAIVILRQQLKLCPGRWDWQRLLRWDDYQQLLRVNRHLFVRTLALLASLAFFTAQGARQGEAILAANAIIMQLVLLTSYGLDGFAHAAEALVGDAVGKRDAALFSRICRQCGLWSVFTALLFTLCYIAFGSQLIALFTNIEALQHQALVYLPWLWLLPLVSVASYVLDGIFIGATQTQAMQSTMLWSVLALYLPCWYFTQSWGNHGLWFAFLVLNVSRGLLLTRWFFHYQRQQGWW